MTKGQLIARVKANLDDNNIFYSVDDYNDALQDAYDDTVVDTLCIEKQIDITLPANFLYHNLPAYIPDFLAVRAIYNPRINLWLEPISLLELKAMRHDWEKAVAQPTHYCPLSWEYIIVWPTYTSDQTYTVKYAAQAETLLGANDSVDIYPNASRIPEDYCTADLLEQAQEIKKAELYWAVYEAKKKQLCVEIVDRMLSDRTAHLSGSL